jgi:N-acetylglucosaminyldiphosphoundecaprenol N-acetyl-beta-D-mannosaminyltransferase
MRPAAADVMGVPVDDVTPADVGSMVASFVDQSRSTGRSFQIATVNVDFVVKANEDPSLMDILRTAELCVPDGAPLLWLSKLQGTPLRERAAGADLVPALVRQAADLGHRVLFFGSADGVAERAAALMAERCPGVSVVGHSGPMMRDVAQMEQAWLEKLIAANADIVCVALGNPKQERWIAEYRSQLPPAVHIGIGGSLDLLVGDLRRAPRWMQRIGFEWLFRALQEPKRLGRRYAHDIRVFVPVLASAMWGRVVRRNVVEHRRRSAELAQARHALRSQQEN